MTTALVKEIRNDFVVFNKFFQLLLVRKPCAQYHLELDKVKKSPEIQNKLKENEKLFKELTDLTGKEVKDFDDVQDIFSTLRAEVFFCNYFFCESLKFIFRKQQI